MLTRSTFLPLARTRRTSLFAQLSQAVTVWKQRRHLENLDADALKDIGISAREAHSEANRALWDVPAQWKCR